MATKHRLTWDKNGKRWKKVYKGQPVYLSPRGTNKTDEQAYKLALDEWQQKKSEIDNAGNANKPNREQYEQAIALREEMIRYCLLEGPLHQDIHDKLVKEIKWLRANFAKTNPPKLDKFSPVRFDPTSDMPISEKMEWFDRIDALQKHEQWTTGNVNPEQTIGAYLERYRQKRIQEAKSGIIKPCSYSGEQCNLTPFLEYLSNEPIEAFNGKQLSAFKELILKRMAEGQFGKVRAKNIFTAVKTFIRWLWRIEAIQNLPRTLSDLTIELDDEEPEPLPLDVVKAILNEATGKLKLYVLLMLNIGAYQNDISELRPDQIDFEQGRIFRKRSKREGKKNALKVCYKLWPETLALLKQYANKEGDRALLNEAGKPLRQIHLKENDKVQNTDAIAQAFREKLTIKFQAKRLRKTSSALLYNKTQFRGLAELFLSHSAKTMIEKHYAPNDQTTLDEAIDWLGQQYGIVPSAVLPD